MRTLIVAIFAASMAHADNDATLRDWSPNLCELDGALFPPREENGEKICHSSDANVSSPQDLWGECGESGFSSNPGRRWPARVEGNSVICYIADAPLGWLDWFASFIWRK